MNSRLVMRYIGAILKLEGLLMAVPLLLSLYEGEMAMLRGFGISMVLTIAVGFLLSGVAFPRAKGMRRREGFVIVSLGWIAMSLLGALPFWFGGVVDSFLAAVFESVSCFTTTAATTIHNLEALPRGMLLWMGLSHWIGGMGVLVLLVAVTPKASEEDNSYNVLAAEQPGHSLGRMVPRLRQNVKLLYLLYVGLTLLLFLLLLAGRMPAFDSLITAFATAGTGGFAIRNASLGAYGSMYIELVVAAFMILFGINFNFFFFLLTGNWDGIRASEELRWYLGIIGVSTLLIAVNLTGSVYGGFGEALRYAVFQVSSMASTAGFSTADFGGWPQFSKALLLVLAILGATSGSTGGGLKVSRLLILLKGTRRRLHRHSSPRVVETVKLGGKVVDNQTLHNVYAYVMTYVALYVLSVLLIAWDGFDFETTLSAVAACLGNVGTGFGLVSATGNFQLFSSRSKLVMIAAMFLGRLEIYPVMLLFSRRTWRRIG